MVRVISVHHFASQHQVTIEQPTASTVAPPNRLLLALSSHCVEVRDLRTEGDVSFTFPTVDEVAQIHHCINGDYVATLESKFNRQNRELNFVRVYVNWDSVAALQQSKMNHSGASLGQSECGMVQPMRARIAGRVTPTTNQSELGSLEMIEIPTKRNPDRIAVCQISGNLLILSGKKLTVYKYVVRTHDISKLKFIDFEDAQFGFQLSFAPSHMAIAENYVACLNDNSMLLFRIVSGGGKEVEAVEMNNSTAFKYDDGPIDYKKLLRDESLNLTKDFTVNLPSIMRENSAVHRHSPFTYCDRELKAELISENRSNCLVRTESLVQLKLRPIMIENAQKQISEEFKDLVLKPLYIDEALNKAGNKYSDETGLCSTHRGNLHSVACVIATQQEGYLYHFNDKGDFSSDNCITVYPFTAPVYKLVMEDYFLHALTETGLESYTLRTCHKLCRSIQIIDDTSVACPCIGESVCLVGLRPFLCIENILITDSHLILLGNGESSPTHSVGSSGSSTTSYWSVHILELPSARTIFHDISIVADAHRFSSAQTYRHLMSEAHMILRSSLILNKWTNGGGTSAKPRRSVEEIRDVYKTSCALLADHYIMSSNEDEYRLAVPYYKMGCVSPSDVIKRVKKIQHQTNISEAKGLIHYLKVVLFDTKLSPDLFGSSSKQNFAESVLDLFERYNFRDLPNLILKVGILREFGTDRLINILNTGIISPDIDQTEKIVALVVLYNLRDNSAKARELLQEINTEDLRKVLLENWELLFESFGSRRVIGLSFSELAVMLMNVRPDLLAELLLAYVNDKRVITLGKLLKVFLEYLPSSIGNDANQGSLVLQKTLELHFARFFQKYELSELCKVIYDRPTHDAMKLLVRSYLSQLQFLQMRQAKSIAVLHNDSNLNCDQDVNKTKNNKKAKVVYLFWQLRHEYLNYMPPFNDESATKSADADLILKKLQALLCSQAIPNQVILEVNTFLTLNEELRGNASLQSIIMTVNDGVLFLVDNHPQCILHYAKDRFTRPDEWKFLIASVQSHILHASHAEEEHSFSYKKLLKDILTHVATNMNLEHLILVFPQHMNYSTSYMENNELNIEEDNGENSTDILNEIQDYEPYITLCKETMHANQIKKLITATGQQLLCTLNL
ncbi:PREDICTED: Hermansky-Pudlak syndrome 3 protein homolog isoform X2 [Nicrophorus vespilloides]|uniref:Hermansky-Pudlak syndrome 3 protein homolog isoform X2 n=1 Tax=Nicrophorus vespilloides TaxID=110193 RepID=A0ABM1M8I6_NICVS|nr:PREDICTED: Hermansky-Pudlak syndrome 3 protein homolog isoform X2 [Nicrophorus vespilloides]